MLLVHFVMLSLVILGCTPIYNKTNLLVVLEKGAVCLSMLRADYIFSDPGGTRKVLFNKNIGLALTLIGFAPLLINEAISSHEGLTPFVTASSVQDFSY